jgi:hypothetical protein
VTQENLISSVRNRLKNISQKRKLDFQFVLTRYALERFLYRLSKSKYKNQFQFDGGILVDAISSTFRRRRTNLPERVPLALSDEFSGDSQKLVQWKAFLGKSGLQLEDDFRIIINYLRDFLFPPLNAAAKREKFNKSWKNGGPWK